MRSVRSHLFYWYLRSRRPLVGSVASIAAQRREMERQLARLPRPRRVTMEPVAAGGLPAEWVRAPGARGDRAVLYLHGGGYVIGSCRTARPMAAALTVAGRCPVLSLDYRLAPEHPFPAAIDDAAGAFRWLLGQGIPAERTAIAGDSAGGGLALATTLALRDLGEPLPAVILCFSPWTDLTVSGESCITRARADPIIDCESLATFADAYTAAENPRAPLVSPLYADLTGLPPLLIQVGSREVLLSDSLRLAEAAREAGLEVSLETWDGMWHVWQQMAAVLPEGRQAIQSACAFLEECLG